jgi:hypothetical protein
MPRFPKKSNEENDAGEEELGGQMSFLEHLDELRKRLIELGSACRAAGQSQRKQSEGHDGRQCWAT